MTRPAVLEVGYICGAHGLAGEVAVRTFDPQSEVLSEVTRAVLELKDRSRRELTFASLRAGGKQHLVKFKEITTRSEAEGCVGARLFVFREELEPLEDGECYQGDLVGLKAIDEQGRVIGTVEEVWNTGPVPNLVIRGPTDLELLIPLVDEFVPNVDLDAGTVVIRKLQFNE